MWSRLFRLPCLALVVGAADPEPIHPLAIKPEQLPPPQVLGPARVSPVIDPAGGCAKPAYPAAAIESREEGVVDLEFLIDEEGHAVDGHVVRSSGHPDLDEAARQALAKCAYKPGTVDGKAESAWVRIRYEWSLEK